MMLTMKTKYGLKALGILAREYGRGPLLASRISEQERIPQEFLRFILAQLKNEGLLHSKKGKGGGYYLRHQPSTISVGYLVRVLEGPLDLLPCVNAASDGCSECADGESCAVRSLFMEASKATANVLDQTTLADFAASGL